MCVRARAHHTIAVATATDCGALLLSIRAPLARAPIAAALHRALAGDISAPRARQRASVDQVCRQHRHHRCRLRCRHRHRHRFYRRRRRRRCDAAIFPNRPLRRRSAASARALRARHRHLRRSLARCSFACRRRPTLTPRNQIYFSRSRAQATLGLFLLHALFVRARADALRACEARACVSDRAADDESQRCRKRERKRERGHAARVARPQLASLRLQGARREAREARGA